MKRYYIGMDVYKESVQMAVYEEAGNEPVNERELANDLSLLVQPLF